MAEYACFANIYNLTNSSMQPCWYLNAISTHACTETPTPDLTIRPDTFSGAASEVAKRTQRGSKEEAMRRTEHKSLIVKQQQTFSRRIYQLSQVLPKSVPGFTE
jgi:hypothetical protein